MGGRLFGLVVVATWALCATGHAQPAANSRPVTASTVPEGAIEIRTALGLYVWDHRLGESTGMEGLFEAHCGITDRLQWAVPLPTLVYRGGVAGEMEWIPWGGVTEFGIGIGGFAGLTLRGAVGLGVDLRWWIGPRFSIVTRLGTGAPFLWRASGALDHAPTFWGWVAGVGFTSTVGDLVTLAVGMRYGETFVRDGEIAVGSSERWPRLAIGSFPLALRSLPLVQLHLTDVVSLDAHVTATYETEGQGARGEYLLGATFQW